MYDRVVMRIEKVCERVYERVYDLITQVAARRTRPSSIAEEKGRRVRGKG